VLSVQSVDQKRKESAMLLKPVVRSQAQLPFRRSYKPGRKSLLRVGPRSKASRTLLLTLNPACAPEGAWRFSE
jgi:hypothetical protein